MPSLTAGDSAGDAFGNTYLVHGGYTFPNPGSIIKKLDHTGRVLWERTHPMAAFRVEVGNDHRAVISGFPNSGTPGAAFIKLDEDGSLLWANLDADGPLALLSHAQMRLDSDNNAYLAAGTLSEMAVCKVNADGTSGWTQTIPFGNALSIALGNTDASVYVVGGTTARLAQGGILTLPSPPTQLSYSTLTATSLQLSWRDNASNESGFIVERCTGTMLSCALESATWTVLATLAANTTVYADTGLAPATTYNWRVKAYNAAGSSAYSNTLALTTPAVAPAAPSGLTAQARRVKGKPQVLLNWTDNANNETAYSVERCAGVGCTNFGPIATLQPNATSHTDNSVVRATTYRYRVRAVGSGMSSDYSNIASVITP